MLENFLLQEGAHVYLLIFLGLLGGAIGLPIPEDIPLIAAGILAQLGQAKLSIIAPLCYVAILSGDFLIFMVGRKLGPALFSKPWFRKRLPPNRIRRFKLGLEKRSLPTIFLARHLFYLRTVTFLACGAVKMKTSRFLIADAVAALLSVPLMIGIGYFAAQHYEQVVKNLQHLFLVLAVIFIIFAWIWSKRHSRRLAERAERKAMRNSDESASHGDE